MPCFSLLQPRTLSHAMSWCLQTIINCVRDGTHVDGGTVYVGMSGVALTLTHIAQALQLAGPGSQLAKALPDCTPASLSSLATKMCAACAPGAPLAPHRSVSVVFIMPTCTSTVISCCDLYTTTFNHVHSQAAATITPRTHHHCHHLQRPQHHCQQHCHDQQPPPLPVVV